MRVWSHAVGLLSRSDGDYARKSGKEGIGDSAPVFTIVGMSKADTKAEHRCRG
jgi:hypothetical protein